MAITHSDQSYNCSFNGTLCRWRNVVNKFYMDGLQWQFGNAFIYVSSLQHQGQTKAYLISPRLDSPYCMQFNYSIANDHSSLDVVILSKNPTSVFKIWIFNKTTKFKMTQITLPHSGIYQVTIIASPNGKTAVALSGMSLVRGFCDGHEKGTQKYGDCSFETNTLHGGLCLWHNEYNTDFEWTIRSKSTPTINTGPTTQIVQQCKPQEKSNSSKEGDVRLVGLSIRGELQIYHNNTWGSVCYSPWHSLATNVVCQQLGHRRGGKDYYIYLATPHLKWISNVKCKGIESRLADCNFDGWGINQCKFSRKAGIECYLGPLAERPCTIISGTFIYLEASSPRNPGDKARISSPWMSGNLCMTFDYHMYGSTMSCVVIYVRQKGSSVLKPLWVKSGDRGNKWYKGMVPIGINNYYQIVIEGIRGTSDSGDATIDDITFTKGSCHLYETKSFSLMIKGEDLQFDWKQPTIESNGFSNWLSFQINTTVFGPQVYTYNSLHMLSTKLDTRDAKRFPQDSFPLQQNASKKIYLASPNSKREVQANRYTAKKCCKEVTFSFGVTDITKRETSMCGNEWYQVDSSCVRFVVRSLTWSEARLDCLKLGGSLATFDSLLLTSTSQIFKKFNFNKILHTGFQGSIEWIWSKDGQTLEPNNLWGPGEPNEDGICGALLDASAWDKKWKGYHWNDLPCGDSTAYICQDIRSPKSPISFYPLDGYSSTREASPDSLPRGTPSNVILDDGPRGEPNGSYYFNGSPSSNILLPLLKRLDIMTSLTILVWVYPEAHGVVVSYGTGLEIYVTKQTTIAATIPFKWQTKPYSIESKGIQLSSWVHIAVWYDYYKGLIGIRVGNQTIVSRILLPRKSISADSDIKLGASLHGNQAFKGQITSLQIYDDTLSEKEIEHLKDIQPEFLRCHSGFVAVRGNCFFIGNINVKGVDQAKLACSKMNATLAKIHSEYIRNGIEAILNNIKPKFSTYYIGFEGYRKWMGRSNEVLPLNSSLWFTGSPRIDRFGGSASYATLSTNSLKLTNENSTYKAEGAICMKHEVNVAYKCNTSASSDAPHSSPSYAVDGDRTTCYSSQLENKPFLQIDLPKEIFLHKVMVTKNKDCCKQPYSKINVMVTDDNNATRACGSAEHYGVNDVMEFYCSPTVRARFVKVTTSDDRNVSLVLCEVELFKIDRGDMHGVRRQIWFNVDKTATRIKDDVMFSKRPDSEDTIKSLNGPVDLADYYAQHLVTFLQIPSTGSYKFTVTCDDECDLLVGFVSEEGIGYTPTKKKQILAYTQLLTGRYQWDKFKTQISSPILLHQCLMYRMDVYIIEYNGGDHVLVRMEHANGGPREIPINNNRLYRTLTGKRVFNIQLGKNNTHHALVAPSLSFRVSMHYCCEGIYCINCPLKVYLVFMNQEYLISQSLPMNCKDTNATVTINKLIQPGNYSVQAAFDFVNQSAMNASRTVGHIIIKVNQMNECSFTRGICGWLHSNDGDLSWTALNERISTKDHSVVINGRYSASLQSDEIKLKSFSVQSGLCLQFLYLLPLNKSMVFLEIYQVANSIKTLLWNITGYHGNSWLEGRVPLKASHPFKVEFYGEGDVNNTVNVAVTDIKVSTRMCTLTPSYAKPGFQCKDNEFQCKNRHCVDKNLKCSGDKDCIDGSDEESCCPTNKFLCPSGKCISTNSLCDGQNDCPNSADEDHCDRGCKEFQCASGSCLKWSSTCTDKGICPEQSSNPKICGNNHCPLNNIGCLSNQTDTNNDESVCRTFTGPCSFDNGDLCGLTHDQDAAFLWTFKSDETQTPSTGPETDHTQISEVGGTYIYTEASSRHPGDKARLVSGWLNANNPLCLQFWYHMHGNHIGSLRILVHTNYSEQVVWELHGNQGNIWRFGQTALNSTSKYKFVLEGETTGGIEGDIAIDDVTLYDGSCQTILFQKTSPSCGFEHDSCGWTSSSSQWIRNQSSKRMVYMDDGKNTSTLVSPLINQNESEWGCFRFWYLTYRQTIEQHSINVSMESLGKNKLLMVIEQQVNHKWQFVQLPLPQGKTFKISISATLAVSIDEISFTKDICQPIPWNDTRKEWVALGCYKDIFRRALGTAYLNSPFAADAKDAFKRCKTEAQKQGYDYFGVQYEGRYCLSSKDAFKTYRTFGCSNQCDKHGDFGIGRVSNIANFVYHLKSDWTDCTYKECGEGEKHKIVLERDVSWCRFANWKLKISSIRGTCPARLPCDGIICKNTSNEWCSWKVNETKNSMNNTWVMTSQPVLYSYYKEHNITKTTGDRMVLKGNTTGFLISRVNYRSYTSAHVCFIFRYMMYGADVDSLTMFVRHDNQSDLTPIWVDNDGNSNEWRYGQVQVTAMATFQVYFKGKVKGRLGYIAIGTTYFNEGDCTEYTTLRKFRVFNKTITAPGYITSPFYPGYYIRDIEYRWYIKAPKNHVLRLTFLDFLLESDIKCSQDFVQVYDEKESTSASLGRFCGFAYPKFIMTTTNNMIVIFHSNINGAVRRGFKARLQFIKDQSKISGKKCTRREGCPSSCKCIIVQNKNSKHKEKMLIQGIGKLYSVPENMPTSTFALFFGNGHVNELKAFSFNDLPSLLYVDLAHNIVVSINDDAFVNATSLETLRLNSNFITFARNPPKKPFRHLRELITLDLGNNFLTTLPEDVFFGLSSLKVLGLRSNRISKIPSRLFYNTRNLTHLYLQDNLITTLPDYGFKSLSNLQLLNLGSNRITELRRATFDGLTSLRHLNLSNNKLTHVSIDAFVDLDNLEYLELDRFVFCCYAKKAIGGLQECKSPTNGFSSCDDLMKNQVLRVCIWILGLMALLGNAFVIVWRVGENQKHGQVHSMLLTNLAVADFLMGVYLITIASMDMKWKGEYFKHDIEWRSGIGCRLTGMISMLSSEVSVAMLAVVTCDRLICIVFPFSTKKITKTRGIIICSFTWIVFLVASVVPIFGLNYFSTDDDDFGFYGRSSVCLPMQLSADRPAGWEYSVVFFMGFNFVAFAFMLIAYIIIFIKVKRSSATVRSTAAKRESSLARKAIFIITTDFICWMPVIIISMLSTTGLYYDPTKQVYVWIAVFVLPINSSINPYLYTISNLNIRKKVPNKKIEVKTKQAKRFAPEAHCNRAFTTDSRLPPFTGTEESATDQNVSHQNPSMNLPISTNNGPQFDQLPCKYEITLIERSKVLHEDIKVGTGYLIAMVKSFELCMIKYFSPNLKNAWATEAAIVETLGGELHHENLLSYRWHSPVSLVSVDDSKVKVPQLEEHFLICYDFVSSTSLQDYLDNECSLTFSMVCSFAMDVITAIGYLHEKNIYHNNINTRTILIAPNSKTQSAHLKAVLSDYSYTVDLKNNLNEDKSSDIQQFADLLETLLQCCDDFEEYREINDLVFLCTHESSTNTAMIKERLSELKEASNDLWDTKL